ncbi:helix-turn-helix domain-containing protein [Shimia thalassica]|nr:helix-turn-helix domain-containing protein [Shimia thalassica]MDO6477989.1 helix-turn-helix domain-containing protein [Shimia thalassica]MDO6522152.1 helix-turn-helix domain-containing protein [Shimia thalassica]MDP2518952.1 helix-turn-helix domain-containing protein [Shimia thalassica]
MTNDLQLYTSKEVMGLLGVSESTLWRRIKDGTIPTPTKIAGLRRWRHADLAQMIADATPEPAHPVRKRSRAA